MVSVLLRALVKALTVDNIQPGFVKSGGIDYESRRYQSFDGMYSTMLQNKITSEYNTMKEDIGQVIAHYKEHGYGSNGLFDQLSMESDNEE